MTEAEIGLRERKKRRTRQALAEAALRLFAQQGYEHTTVADIAAAAEVSTRTFFAYFPTKEDVVLADTDERLQVMRETLAGLPPGTPPALAARQMVERVFATGGALFGPDRTVRATLVLSRPELRAKALERLLAAQQEFTGWLCTAHPTLDPVRAVTVSGALVGGLVGAALASVERGAATDRIHAALDQAVAMLERGLDSIDG